MVCVHRFTRNATSGDEDRETERTPCCCPRRKNKGRHDPPRGHRNGCRGNNRPTSSTLERLQGQQQASSRNMPTSSTLKRAGVATGPPAAGSTANHSTGWAHLCATREQKTQVTFHDVAASFSEEQWKLLHEWQKELYRNVMKEIHQALTALGPLIATSVFSLKAKESEDLYCMDHQDSERNFLTQSARDTSITQTVSYDIKEEAEDDFMDSEICESGEHLKIPTGRTEMDPTVSFTINGEENHFSSDNQDCKIIGCLKNPNSRTEMDPTVSFTINGEENHFSSDNQDCKIIGCLKNPNTASGVKNQDWSFAEKRAQSATLNGKNKMQAFQHSDKEEMSSSQTLYPGTQRYFQRNILEHCTEFKVDTDRSINSVNEQRTLKEKKNYSHTNCLPSISQCLDHPVNHQKTKDDLPYACSENDDRFVKRSTYGTHSRDVEAHECASCGKSINVSSNTILQEEFHAEERTHVCTECGKSFFHRSALTNHQRTHTGEKPYTCIECGKSFSDRSNYVRHQRTHTGEKPFKCSICGKCYSDHSNYTKHQRSHIK